MSYQVAPQPSVPQPIDPDRAFEDALNMVNAARFDEALETCRKILAVQPDNDRACHMYGFLLLQQGDPDAALASLEKSAALGSTNPLMFMHLGIARATGENHLGAIEAFEKAVVREPALAPS